MTVNHVIIIRNEKHLESFFPTRMKKKMREDTRENDSTTRHEKEKSKRVARDKHRRCSLHSGGKSMSSNLFHLDKALSSKVADEHDPSDPG